MSRSIHWTLKKLFAQKSTREIEEMCDYSFSLLDGSVFVDFSKKGGLIYLVRISFDGYGCYAIQGSSNPLNKEHSKSFLKIAHSKTKDKIKLSELIRNAIKINRPLLNADKPLQKHKLIDDSDFILCHNKYDAEAIEKITEHELRTNPELYAGLLECFQDMNWPVAKIALDKMIFDDKKILPYIKAIFTSNDDEWIYFVKNNIMPLMSRKNQKALRWGKNDQG